MKNEERRTKNAIAHQGLPWTHGNIIERRLPCNFHLREPCLFKISVNEVKYEEAAIPRISALNSVVRGQISIKVIS